ncbi:MAG: c-type cytochrome biogenesis protein CcsB [Deltaproteobacteria bacterium]|nr:c-type cytochrome biogenesis protein CcsB [Deltaproteobacteria bacterium]
MDKFQFITIFFYMLSTAGYVAYLFFQKNYWQKAGYVLLSAGLGCHTLFIVLSYLGSGLFPGRNLHQTLVVACWAFSGMFVLIQYKFNLKILGVYAAPVAAAVMIMAAGLPTATVSNSPFFKSFWLFFHLMTTFLGHAAFALACGVGGLYLLQERAIKTKQPGFFFRRLPSLNLLDRTGYACIVSGFMMLTIGLVAGVLYAKTAWGRFWSWDSKEVWTAIVWLFYAVLLHERIVSGWRGRKAAIMSIVGFGLLLFTFLGVNLLLEGHHGEFTRW